MFDKFFNEREIEALSFVAVEDNIIYIYHKGALYSTPLRSIVYLDAMCQRVLKTCCNIDLDDFLCRHKSSIKCVIYDPSVVSFIDVYIAVNAFLTDTVSVRFISIYSILAAGMNDLWLKENLYCLAYKDNYLIYETGFGCIEICNYLTSREGIQEYDTAEEIIIDETKFYQSFVKGSVAVILSKFGIDLAENPYVMLDILDVDLGISIEAKDQVLEYIHALDYNTIIPCVKTLDLDTEGGSIYFCAGDRKVKIPLDNLFTCIPQKLKVEINISRNRFISIKFIDVFAKVRCSFTLYELLTKYNL